MIPIDRNSKKFYNNAPACLSGTVSWHGGKKLEKELLLDSLSNTAEQKSACNPHLQDVLPNSVAFLDSAYYAPESVLPHSFLLQHAEPEKIEHEIPKSTRKHVEIDQGEKVSSRSSHIGLIASTSVGILVALFLFPMIRLAERGTRSFVTESYTGEIVRRVDQYEQLNSNLNANQIVEEMVPVNLALNGWKEVRSEIFSANDGFDTSTAHFSDKEILGFLPILWMDTEGFGEPIPLDMLSLSDRMLLVMLGQEGSVRSAFGQDILFKDGRIFFRDLR